MRSEWVELEGVQVKSEHQFERLSEVVCWLSSEGKEGKSEKSQKRRFIGRWFPTKLRSS